MIEPRNTITIRRPNGAIETVDVTTKFSNLTDEIIRKMRNANLEAGSGEIIARSNAYGLFCAASRAAHRKAERDSRKAERAFDAINNEGGEGYNPYR